MSIKKVKSIPKPFRVQKAEPFEYQTKLLQDFEKAWIKHYDKFEFTGYENPNYLTTYAKKIAHKFLLNSVLIPAYREATEKLQKRFKKEIGEAAKYISVRPPFESAEPAIKITGVTVLGEKRVFGEIDWDYINNMPDRIVKESIPHFSKREVQAKYVELLDKEKRKACGELTIREYNDMMRKQRNK